MLENCTKKRMLLSLGTLVVVTIIVLIFESRVTDQSRHNRTTTPKFEIESNSTCWKKERFTILHDCHPCPEEETSQKMSGVGVCIHTNFMEVIQCSSGLIVARSCDKAALNQQKDFITFEVTMLVAGTFAFLVSYIRLRLLNRRTHLKIEKQLAAKGWIVQLLFRFKYISIVHNCSSKIGVGCVLAQINRLLCLCGWSRHMKSTETVCQSYRSYRNSS